MENYIIIKDLPDASAGTEVIWDKKANAYYYEKGLYVSPHNRNYLSSGQVTQTPEYFCKLNEYPEHYSYNMPVYCRKEIIDLVEDIFYVELDGSLFGIEISKKVLSFHRELKKLGKLNAKRIINNQLDKN